jgi:hypothetical protein
VTLVSCCLSTTGIRFSEHPVPAEGLGLPCGRLTRPSRLDLNGVSTLRMEQLRPGGTPSLPRDGGVLLIGEWFRPAPAASQRPVLQPALASHLGEPFLTRHYRGFTLVRPIGLVLACGPWMEQGPLGFYRGLRTPRLLATHATADTELEHCPESQRPCWPRELPVGAFTPDSLHTCTFHVAPTRRSRRRAGGSGAWRRLAGRPASRAPSPPER